jgi:phospholipid-binding lipoprotein MlaA
MNATRPASRWRQSCSLAMALMLAGCATTQDRDPLEPFNRKVFGFNEAVDAVVVKPVATGFAAVTPSGVQTGIANFINNFKDVWSAVNLLLQGRPGAAAQELLRVGVNSTFGLAGFVDVATSMELDRHNEDLGQTLGTWGVPDGAYIVLPFFGPSNVRDAVALPADQYFTPARSLMEPRDATGMRIIQVISARAQALEASDLLSDVALDKYAFVRDAYIQRRRNMIYNGEPPEDQSLWAPETAPATVLWAMADLTASSRPALDAVLAVPSTGRLSALWQQGARCVTPATLPMGALASNRLVPMQAPTAQLPLVQQPTPDELAGLRADEDVR